MAALLGGLPGALADQVVDARAFFGGPWAGHVAERHLAQGGQAALASLFAFVRRRVQAVGVEPLRAAQALQHRWTEDVGSAARGHGCSVRQFERRYLSTFGVGPKRYQRMARVECAMRHVIGGGRTGADLAFQLGYYDQSHLARDLRDLGGLDSLARANLAGARAGGEPSLWPLRLGAGYGRAGIRADFPPPGASLFS
jgi:AraC-like DNA-binding protein